VDGFPFEVPGFLFEEDGLHFEEDGFPFEVPGFHFEVDGFPFEVDGFHFEVEGFPFEVPGFLFEVEGFPFEVETFRCVVEDGHCPQNTCRRVAPGRGREAAEPAYGAGCAVREDGEGNSKIQGFKNSKIRFPQIPQIATACDLRNLRLHPSHPREIRNF
jgi:hypothetical protein